MSVRIKVTSESNPKWHQDFEFEQGEIVIGRDIKCDIKLEGTESVVSREHTKLHKIDERFKVRDLQSLNFTFLNGQRLEADVEYDLKSGDTIKICEFNLAFSIQPKKISQIELTKPIVNPFTEQAKALAEEFIKLRAHYKKDESIRKQEKLEHAMHSVFRGTEYEKTRRLLTDVLVEQGLELEPSSKNQKSEQTTDIDFDRQHQVFEVLLDFLARLIQARRQFRLEFLGETMIVPTKFSIQDCSFEELKKYIQDPEIQAAEYSKRIALIKKTIEEISCHQVAMLDGYQESVNEGLKTIIDKFDPEKKWDEIKREPIDLGVMQIPSRLLPFVRRHQLIKSLKLAYQELEMEDQSIYEKKYFRPFYIRAYHKFMDSAFKKASKKEK